METLKSLLHKIDILLPQDTSITEEKSDVVHDFLAFLAEQMMELNRQKQQEVKGFLVWLEGYLGVKIEALTSRNKLTTYYETDWDEFLEILKKNNHKIPAADITRKQPTAKIQAEFEASRSKLNPIFERIRLTDTLIDQIVYKLYQLTDEEIRTVEESITPTYP